MEGSSTTAITTPTNVSTPGKRFCSKCNHLFKHHNAEHGCWYMLPSPHRHRCKCLVAYIPEGKE